MSVYGWFQLASPSSRGGLSAQPQQEVQLNEPLDNHRNSFDTEHTDLSHGSCLAVRPGRICAGAEGFAAREAFGDRPASIGLSARLSPGAHGLDCGGPWVCLAGRPA